MMPHFRNHLPLVNAVPCGIEVRDRGHRRACRCGTDRGGIDHPDDLSSRRQPGAVRTLYLNLRHPAAWLWRTPARTCGRRDRRGLDRFLCHASIYHNSYLNTTLQPMRRTPVRLHIAITVILSQNTGAVSVTDGLQRGMESMRNRGVRQDGGTVKCAGHCPSDAAEDHDLPDFPH